MIFNLRHIGFAALLSVWAVSAQAENVVKMHAVYLDAPTPWCAADEGVPVMVTMDGPDVGGTLESKFFVTQMHGTERVRVPIPAPEGYSDPSSAHTGRFSAQLEVCHRFWEISSANVEWQVAKGAETLASGSFDGHFTSQRALPLFQQRYGSEDLSLRLSDEVRLIAKGPIEITKTTEAFASPAEE